MPKPDSEGLGMLLHGSARAWRLNLDRRLKPLGLSQARWRTLLHLARTPDSLTQSELAESLDIEEPTLVTLLHGLERTGWIRRVTSAKDRRCKVVKLLPRARRVIARIDSTASTLRRELLTGIPLRELQTCARVLEKIRERAEHPPSAERPRKLTYSPPCPR